MDQDMQKWILLQVEQRSDWFVELCQRLVQIPSPNPPGDTTRVAEYIKGLLDDRAISYKEYTPRERNPNIVASLGSGSSPKLSLNGHMDVFPIADPSEWTDDPYSGTIRNGKLYGRGSSDMKAGFAAALGTFLMMAEEKVQFDGTVVLSMVSDEENLSEAGTWWLAENVPEILGDACLIGEPTGCLTPLVGQKAPLWVRLTTHSRAKHGASSNGRDAVWQMARAIVAIQTLNELVYASPKEIAPLVAQLKRKEQEAGSGNDWWLEQPSVNFGHISGGVKINVVPSSCELEVDLRVPFGATSADLMDELRKLLAKTGVDAEVEVIMGQRDKPNFTDWEEPFLQLLKEAIQIATGEEPKPLLMPYATDERVFRKYGIPAASCGPKDYGKVGHGMAGPDEHILINEYLQVVRVFGLTTAAFCRAHVPENKGRI